MSRLRMSYGGLPRARAPGRGFKVRLEWNPLPGPGAVPTLMALRLGRAGGTERTTKPDPQESARARRSTNFPGGTPDPQHPLAAPGHAEKGAERGGRSRADLGRNREAARESGEGSDSLDPAWTFSGRAERDRPRRTSFSSPPGYRGSLARRARSARTAATLAWNAARSATVRSTSTTRSTPPRPSRTGTPM